MSLCYLSSDIRVVGLFRGKLNPVGLMGNGWEWMGDCYLDLTLEIDSFRYPL